MIEIILMPQAVYIFRSGQVDHLRKYDLKQTACIQQIEPDRRLGAEDDLIQFVRHPFLRNDGYAMGVFPNGLEGRLPDGKVQLGGKPYRTHHAQGVVAEGADRVKGGADEPLFEIAYAPEGIDQAAIVIRIKADRHGIDGEITTKLIVFDRAG